jgi:uncharacterized membrane protein SpoIIM required for sporulation
MFDFPRALRANASFLAAATALFLVPMLAVALACWFDDDFIFSVMDAGEVRAIESMYNPANEVLGRERAADSDAMMFGFYIQHNISIALRSFASGILIGVGPALALIFNGTIFGALAVHLGKAGFAHTFFPFVIAHAAFELTAIVFSGAAGLKVGFSFLAPGSLPRRIALRRAAGEAMQIMYGAALMLLIAAFLEAFWSSRTTLPPNLKYAVGATFWAMVLAYCARAGRAPVSADTSHGT